MTAHLIGLGWDGLTPCVVDLLNPNRWMWLHPMFMMEETFGRLQGDNCPRQMIVK